MLTVTVLAVILLMTIFFAWKKGVSQAQADIVVFNARQLEKAMGYFYSDQDRYPTANEFADNAVLGQYVHPLPLAGFSSSVCAESFNYKHPNISSYELQFCIPASSGGFARGWNQMSGQK